MRSIKAIKNLKGKTTLVRVDFNVPIKNGKVEDDFRIRASIPTIKFLLKEGAKVILFTHLGKNGEASLEPVIKCFFEISKISPNKVTFFDNIRKFPGEMKNDVVFAKELAKMGDFYVNEAFSVSHRKHASVVLLPKYLPSFAGFQLEKEVKNLSDVFKKTKHPFLFILSGAKFSTKMPLLKKYLRLADYVFVGGALANNFFKEMVPVIRSHTGFIDKYLGDGIMALFPADADNAVQAAIGMLQKLAIYNQTYFTDQKDTIQIGLGLNSGMLMLGTVGDEYSIDGTVISDSVNIAERVQELTKIYGAPLLITHETYVRLKFPEKYALRKIDTVLVRGKSQPITVYEIFETDLPDIIRLKSQTRVEFENAIALYHAEKFEEAIDLMESIVQTNKNDIPAQNWLNIIKAKLFT